MHKGRFKSLDEFVANPQKLVMLDIVFQLGSIHFLADVVLLNFTTLDYYTIYFEEECVLLVCCLYTTTWLEILKLDCSMDPLRNV